MLDKDMFTSSKCFNITPKEREWFKENFAKGQEMMCNIDMNNGSPAKRMKAIGIVNPPKELERS